MVTLDTGLKGSAHAPEVSERVFGVVVGTLLTIVSTVPLVWGGRLNESLLIVAGSLFGLGLLLPAILKWPKKIWFFITQKIAAVVNFILLGVIFYLVVSPVGLFFKVMGRDSLKRKWDASAPTYWVSAGREHEPDMKKQY